MNMLKISALAAVFASQMSFAQTEAPLAQESLNFAFADASVNALVLGEQEMKATEGEYMNFAIGGLMGGGMGAWGYLGSAAGTGNFRTIDFSKAVITGVAIGAIAGPISMPRYYFAARASGIGGFLTTRW